MADKIRQRVKNPKVAEMLITRDHGFGTRRVPRDLDRSPRPPDLEAFMRGRRRGSLRRA